MASSPRVLRALDPAEKYFWLIYLLNSMMGVFYAYADRRFTEEEIAAALAAIQRRHPFLRARIEVVDGDYAFVEVDGPVEITTRPLASGAPMPIAELQLAPYPEAPHPLVQCLYMPVEGEDRSVLILLMHHVYLDGSSGLFLMRQFARALDGSDTDLTASDAVPPPLHSRFTPALASPREAAEVLAAMRAEREGNPPPEEMPFHDRHVAATYPRHDLLTVSGDDLRALLAAAKAAKATVTGHIDAIFLESAAALFDDAPAPHWISLVSATDLRPRVEPPLPFDDMQLAIGLVATPYLVSPATRDTLARDIGEQIRREVERGESHLFYRFARMASYTPDADGLAAFAKWVDSTPQNVTVSSTGVQDDTGDPPWVHRISATMVPGPNQLSFTSVTTYRGEMVLNVNTDVAKLPPALADRFVEGLMARLGARCAQSTTNVPEGG